MVALPQNEFFYAWKMRQAPALRKRRMKRARFALRNRDAKLRCAFSCRAGVGILKGCCFRLALALVSCLAVAAGAFAETAADTVHKWGLIGPWSVDCSLSPDRNRSTLLAYEIVRDGRVVLRRNFGDSADDSEVVSAEISGDGMLNLRVFFPGLKQTRENGLMMQPDGTMRAIYSRSLNGEYSIRDGKFAANGDPTPALHKCR
jgi:hypothetical protein